MISNNLDNNNLNAFLHLCYLPEVSTEFIQHIIDDPKGFKKQKEWMAKQGKEVLIKEGGMLLKKIFKELIERCPDQKHIIPLSGGLDSRAILAHLIDLGLKDNIVTVTYGIPGAYDYEIGKMVAKFAGVKNVHFNLDRVKILEKDLIYTVKNGGDFTAVTPSFYNRLSVLKLGKNNIYWSGFFGDPFAGSHYEPGYEKLNWQDGKKAFWYYNKWEKNSNVCLTQKDFNYNNVLPENPIIADSKLISYPEQLDFCIRQTAWIKKAIVDIAPDVITPFTNQEWASFMLAVPNELRVNCELYRSILTKEFPEYYSLPTKNLNGKPLVNSGNSFELPAPGLFRRLFPRNINKGINYIDYDNTYRTRKDLINLAEKSVWKLKEKSTIPWLDTVDLWQKHYSGQMNIWQTIEILVSLRLNDNDAE